MPYCYFPASAAPAPARPLPPLRALLWLLVLLAWPATGLHAQVLPRTFAGGITHSLSIHEDGTLWATGDNLYGQLGLPTTLASTSAWVQVGTDADWVMVAAGGLHSLGLKADGRLYAWGLNRYGQLGTSTNTGSDNPNPAPVQVAGTYTQVAAGRYHSLALRADGSLWAWGLNLDEQLGTTINSGTSNANATPMRVGIDRYTQVAAGQDHSLGLRADGSLWAWGLNRYGQLGNPTNDGTGTATATPTRVGTDLYTQVAAGFYHSLGLRADGSLWAWGRNNNGQLGDATSSPATATPVQVAGTYTQAAAGAFHSLGLRADGSLWAWGNNRYGQLGSTTNNDTNTANPTPAQVPGTYTQVAAGNNHSLGLRADGALYAWGLNFYSQLGTTTNSGISTANPVPTATGAALVTRSLAMGESFGLAVRGDGTLWAWGDNQYGQLGTGTTTGTTRPVRVGAATDWVMVAAGQYYSLGLRADGALYAWGNNYFGQLGTNANTNTNTPIPTPTRVGTTELYTQVAAGQYHSLGLRPDGSLWAWGDNAYGQLGRSATISPNSTPTRVGTTDLYTQVAAGLNHSLGLRPDGSLYAWGFNASGQLGIGNSSNSSTPTRVGTALYTQVAAGVLHSLGLRADGTLWAWGNNRYGQLGLGTTSTSATPTPTQEATLGTTWTTLGTGGFADFSLARTPSAQVFASTGQNLYGQLGDGTTTNASRFDRVSPLTSLQPLPVELVQFTATPAGGQAVRLAWATASEKNSAVFQVQRSPDGEAWTTLGTVAAAGTSTTLRPYAYLDAAAPTGTSYYRLKQVDRDGATAYSPVRTVPLAGAALALYPNPAPDRATTLTGAPAGAAVQVLDALGRVRLTATADAAGTARLTLPARILAGVYLVRAGGQSLRLLVE